MGEFKDKVKAAGNEIAGNTKEAVGHATNDPGLKGEGKAQQTKADGQRLKGDIKGALGDDI